MKVLSDKSVLDSKPLAAVEAEEKRRKLNVQFESQVRQVVGVVVVKDRTPDLDPRWDALKGVQL